MNDGDRLQLTRLFVAGLQAELAVRHERGLKDTSVPLDPRAFAMAVGQLGEANGLASRFPVFTTISGPLCPDFQQGMAIAQSAGLVSRLNPSFHRFTVNLSGRQVATLAADPNFADARRLARKYLSLTLGASEADDSERNSAVA